MPVPVTSMVPVVVSGEVKVRVVAPAAAVPVVTTVMGVCAFR